MVHLAFYRVKNGLLINLYYSSLIESFENASEHCRRLRAQLPVHYNRRRQFHRPIPSLNPSSSDSENDDIDDQNVVDARQQQGNVSVHSGDEIDGESIAHNTDSSSINADIQSNASVHSDDEVDGESLAHNSTKVSEENSTNEPITCELESEAGSQNESQNNNEIAVGAAGSGEKDEDIKHSLQTIQMDASDESAINSLFCVNDNSIQLNQNSELVLDAGKSAEKRGDKIVITKIIDDDLQMTYTHGEKLNALQPLYQVKLNDPLSENIPFKENVRIFYGLKYLNLI